MSQICKKFKFFAQKRKKFTARDQISCELGIGQFHIQSHLVESEYTRRQWLKHFCSPFDIGDNLVLFFCSDTGIRFFLILLENIFYPQLSTSVRGRLKLINRRFISSVIVFLIFFLYKEKKIIHFSHSDPLKKGKN